MYLHYTVSAVSAAEDRRKLRAGAAVDWQRQVTNNRCTRLAAAADSQQQLRVAAAGDSQQQLRAAAAGDSQQQLRAAADGD